MEQRAELSSEGDADTATAVPPGATGAASHVAPGGLVTLAFLAVTIRLLYIWFVIPHYVPTSDADQYRRLATQVSLGNGLVLVFPFSFLHASAFRPPLYPALLGSIWALTGGSVGIGQAFNVFLGVVVVVLAAVLGARIGGKPAGWTAGLIVIWYPPLIANDTTLLTEPLSLVLMLILVLLLVDRRVEFAALASGLLVLTRPSAQAFAVVLAGWIVWRFGWKSALRYIVLVILVIAPWVVRNWLMVGEPAIVTSNGFNLAAIYSAQAEQAHGFVDPVFNDAFGQQRYLHYDEADWDRVLQNIALDHLHQHPSYLLQVVRSNTAGWFELGPGRNLSGELLDGRNRDFRNDTIFLFYFVTLAGFSGLILSVRSRVSQLLLITAGYFTTFSLLTVAPPRLRAPFDIAMCIGVGALAGRLGRRSRSAGLVKPKHDPSPTNRAWPARTFVVVVAIASIGLVGGTLAARTRVQNDARHSVQKALGRYGRTPSRLSAFFPVRATNGAVPRTPSREILDQMQHLEAALWRASVQVPQAESAATRHAAIDVNRAETEAAMLGLYVAYQVIHSSPSGTPFDLEKVAQNYERTSRRQNPELPPPVKWLDGVAARDAARSVGRLRSSVGSSK